MSSWKDKELFNTPNTQWKTKVNSEVHLDGIGLIDTSVKEN